MIPNWHEVSFEIVRTELELKKLNINMEIIYSYVQIRGLSHIPSEKVGHVFNDAAKGSALDRLHHKKNKDSYKYDLQVKELES